MAESTKSDSKGKKQPESFREKRARRKPDPVEMQLTMVVNFGDEEDDSVTLFDDHELKMVGSVLNNRDKILRLFVFNLVRAGLMTPRVAREMVPGLTGMLAFGRRDRKED